MHEGFDWSSGLASWQLVVSREQRNVKVDGRHCTTGDPN